MDSALREIRVSWCTALRIPLPRPCPRPRTSLKKSIMAGAFFGSDSHKMNGVTRTESTSTKKMDTLRLYSAPNSAWTWERG